ncbi:MAG: aldo/keto reductase [Candidatus Omnitrophica bacterium]|nr:aldo/keto reductase [Candidatus Omnitrophota bacterium]MDD5671593.1 aldo/keto reductase [Candidatus Omnitrophota bacterium]
MKYRPFGGTGVDVSEIGFGGWAIGGNSYGTVRDEDSLEALEAAFCRGVNFYDTADIYGEGHSEEILAQFLKRRNRSDVLIASKAGFDFYHGAVRKNFEAAYLRFACEQSLQRLGIETIDLYQLHNPPLGIIRHGEAIGVLEELQREGKIRFIGVSIFQEDEGLAALRDKRIQSIQTVFNLLDQRMTLHLLPEAKENEVAIIAREPLACGFLTGKYAPGSEFPKNDHRNGWPKEKVKLIAEKVEKIKAVLATRRLTLTRAALEYVLDFDAVSTVIPGAKTKTQVIENLMASEEPSLRSQEACQLREIYQLSPLFKEGLD